MAAAGMTLPGRSLAGIIAANPAWQPLMQFDYGDVELTSDLHEKQLGRNTSCPDGSERRQFAQAISSNERAARSGR